MTSDKKVTIRHPIHDAIRPSGCCTTNNNWSITLHTLGHKPTMPTESNNQSTNIPCKAEQHERI